MATLRFSTHAIAGFKDMMPGSIWPGIYRYWCSIMNVKKMPNHNRPETLLNRFYKWNLYFSAKWKIFDCIHVDNQKPFGTVARKAESKIPFPFNPSQKIGYALHAYITIEILLGLVRADDWYRINPAGISASDSEMPWATGVVLSVSHIPGHIGRLHASVSCACETIDNPVPWSI